MNRHIMVCALLVVLRRDAVSQDPGPTQPDTGGTGAVSKVSGFIYNYLMMAGTRTAAEFTPQSQKEKTDQYLKSFVNPLFYLKAATSGAIDLKNDKPPEWEQGASGYGKRAGNILGQYGIQRTVTYGVSSLLHEDNRYFGSGQHGFLRRIGHSIAGSFLARHDNGKRYPSVSLVAGFASAAFISRSWQPSGARSMGDGAVSFGYSMGYNALAAVLKEFLPDMIRPLVKHREHSQAKTLAPSQEGTR